jgi:energy-coupling factor transporter transmembrane protein EcfT
MSEFVTYFQVGLSHILDLNGYDHFLFLVALTAPYAFRDWKRVLILVSIFTLGHTLSLLLSIFEIISVKTSLIEFLIPITILITAFLNYFKIGKTPKNETVSGAIFITLFFGIIHGLGFSSYIKALLSGEPTDKILPTLQFAVGIEAAQLLIVIAVLLISFIVQTFFRISRRDFITVTSALIIGVVLPLIFKNFDYKI